MTVLSFKWIVSGCLKQGGYKTSMIDDMIKSVGRFRFLLVIKGQKNSYLSKVKKGWVWIKRVANILSRTHSSIENSDFQF